MSDNPPTWRPIARGTPEAMRQLADTLQAAAPNRTYRVRGARTNRIYHTTAPAPETE